MIFETENTLVFGVNLLCWNDELLLILVAFEMTLYYLYISTLDIKFSVYLSLSEESMFILLLNVVDF